MIQLTDTANIFSDKSNAYICVDEKDKNILPYTKMWDYTSQIKVEDVDLWEVIYEIPACIGIYASYRPMCEFYMIVPGSNKMSCIPHIEFYYGIDAEKNVYNRCKSVGVNLETQITFFDISNISNNFLRTANNSI